MTIHDKIEGIENKRAVSFNTRVTVVLIPERREIREANCDLWWARGDYCTFQQSAHSEIRLFALYENIDCREAKTLLYQPNQLEETSTTNDDDDDYFEPSEELDMSTRDSEAEEAVEECKSAPSSLMRHVDSVSLLSAYNANDVTPMKKSMSSAMNLAVVYYIAALAGVEVPPAIAIAGIFIASVISLSAVSLPGSISFVVSIGPIALAMGVPIEPLALLVAVEMLPDLMRTLGNVTMNVAVTTAVDRSADSSHAPV